MPMIASFQHLVAAVLGKRPSNLRGPRGCFSTWVFVSYLTETATNRSSF